MKLTKKRKYTIHSPETYALVLKLREEHKWGADLIRRHLIQIGIDCTEGVIGGWIHRNKKPYFTKMNQIPESAKKLTIEKAYILGALCGDGWMTTGYRTGLDVTDKEFAYSFKHGLEKVYKLECYIKLIKTKPTNVCANPQSRYYVVLSSKNVYNDLLNYSSVEFKTKTWRVPEQIKTASKEIQASFIRAFADSEGSVKNRHRNRELTLCSGNYGGLNDIKEMLLMTFGINSHLSKRKTELYILTIGDYVSLKKFYDEIGFTIERKRKKLEEGLARYKRKGLRKYSPEFKSRAMELMNQGLTTYQVGKLMGTSHTNVYEWWKIEKSKKFI